MSIVTEILSSAQDGKLIENLAQGLGLSTEQTQAAVEALTPALAIGLRNAASNPAVLEQVVAGVVHPTHQGSYDDPAVAHGEEAGELGQAAVAHLFGSSSVAGQVAQIAARDAGLRPDVLNRLLPVLASVVLGGLFKSFSNQGLGSILGQIAGGGGLGSILGQLGGAMTASAPAPSAPQSGAPQGGGGLGGLLGSLLGGGQQGGGGLLGGLLGALLGGGSAGGGAPAAPGGAGQPSLPGGLDPATLQAALDQIKKSLNPGGATSAASGQSAELQDVLDKVFPKG
jgi:hypothetical protein